MCVCSRQQRERCARHLAVSPAFCARPASSLSHRSRLPPPALYLLLSVFGAVVATHRQRMHTHAEVLPEAPRDVKARGSRRRREGARARGERGGAGRGVIDPSASAPSADFPSLSALFPPPPHCAPPLSSPTPRLPSPHPSLSSFFFALLPLPPNPTCRRYCAPARRAATTPETAAV